MRLIFSAQSIINALNTILVYIWGKVCQIMGILDEVDMATNRVEARLLLRQSILVNSLLYSAEAWSNLTEKQLVRLEVVDSVFLAQLTGGHAKNLSEFHAPEIGTWKHILCYLRLLYNHEENFTSLKKKCSFS